MVHKLFLPIGLSLSCNLSLRRSGAECACMFIYLFIYFYFFEFNKYLLSACYTQDFVSDTWDTSEDKTTVPALMELTV